MRWMWWLLLGLLGLVPDQAWAADPASGDGAGAILDEPAALLLHPTGSLYVAGRGSDNVLEVRPDGSVRELLDGTGAGLDQPLLAPSALALVGADLYVAGSGSDNLLRVTVPEPGAAASGLLALAAAALAACRHLGRARQPMGDGARLSRDLPSGWR